MFYLLTFNSFCFLFNSMRSMLWSYCLLKMHWKLLLICQQYWFCYDAWPVAQNAVTHKLLNIFFGTCICFVCVIRLHINSTFMPAHWWNKRLWEINIVHRSFELFLFFFFIWFSSFFFDFVLSPSQAYLCGPRHWWEQKNTEKTLFTFVKGE